MFQIITLVCHPYSVSTAVCRVVEYDSLHCFIVHIKQVHSQFRIHITNMTGLTGCRVETDAILTDLYELAISQVCL